MAKKKWTRPVAENFSLGDVKNAPLESPKEIRDADPVLMEEKESSMIALGAKKTGKSNIEELKRNKIFDFAGELSMKVCPDVKVMVLNHNVKSIIFTATFEGLSQADIDGVIEASK